MTSSETDNSIPKRLFFIWFGNTVPNYVYFSMDNFKKVNPQFEIVFIHKTVEQLLNIHKNGIFIEKYDKLIDNCINYIKNNEKYPDYITDMKEFYGKNIKFIQILTDVVRLELVNEYGGIYLDCDTFPIRPFDDTLLQLKRFCVSRHFQSGEIRNDNYFFGSQCASDIGNLFLKPIKGGNTNYDLLQTENNWFLNGKFIENRKRFFSLELEYGNYSFNNDFYIEHYNICTRNNIKTHTTQLCILDSYLLKCCKYQKSNLVKEFYDNKNSRLVSRTE